MTRFRPALLAALLSTAVFGAPPAQAASTPHELLTQLAQQMIDSMAQQDPMLATTLGIEGHDGELVNPSEAGRRQRIERLRRWSHEVDAIEHGGGTLTLVDADDAKLLRAQIDGQLEHLLVHETDRKDYAGPALALTDAVFTQFLHLPIPGRDGATPATRAQAWADITARLAGGPAYIEAGQKLVTHPGHLFGTVGAQQLQGVPDFLTGPLSEAARTQLADDPAALQRFEVARDALLATLARSKAYIDAHAASWPENYAIGRKAYDEMLRREKLLPFNGADVELIGRNLLAHGWAEEAWLHDLSVQRGEAFGAASGGGMAPAGAALVGYYRERIDELRRFVDAHQVITIPAWLGAMEVVETPKFLQPVSPGASMNAPRLFAKSTTGYYFITPPVSLEDAAKRLDMNEDFDHDRIMSTAAHEAMPGHFLQLSIAHRHPDLVRRLQDSDAFAEGWAFYGEEMFVRLGLFGDDLDARVFTARWERVRGARAIVDVKLAAGEWSVAQAVDFFVAQTGFTREASQAAIANFALRPGYAIAYSVGRLQLELLLSQYLQHKGAEASLRDFHDRLLSYGTTPFAIVGPELLADLDKPASAVRASANY